MANMNSSIIPEQMSYKFITLMPDDEIDALSQQTLQVNVNNFSQYLVNQIVSPSSIDLIYWSPVNQLNTSTDHLLPLMRYSAIWTMALCIAYLIVFFLGLVGNLSVLWVIFILRRNSRHSMFATCNKVFNGLIGNLALADLLVIIFCLPATLISNIFTRKLHCLISLFICFYFCFFLIRGLLLYICTY